MFGNMIKCITELSYVCHSNNLVIKRFAGHSKWQNIRHIKGEKDAERARAFSKLGIQIRVAVRKGGSADPDKNLKLAQIVEQSKRINMPAATLQSILKSCQADKSNAKGHILEIKGPSNCVIICEIFTDKLHVAKQGIAAIAKRYQLKLSDKSSMYLFDEKGIIDAEVLAGSGESEDDILEKATEHAIECGAEEVKVLEENQLQFSCGSTNLHQVAQELGKIGYKISSASVEFVPKIYQPLSDQELETCEKLYRKLETLPEVVRLSDNIA